MKQCANCGFLSLRQTWNLTLGEAHDSFREKAHVVAGYGNNPVHEDKIPVCFIRAASLQQECGDKSDPQTVLSVIQKDRTNCESHTPWIQGSTPKEHAEMLQLKALQEMQAARESADRSWRDEQSERERLWRDRQAEREHTWRTDDLERDRKYRNQDRSLAMSNLVLAALVATVSVIATLVAAKLLPFFN